MKKNTRSYRRRGIILVALALSLLLFPQVGFSSLKKSPQVVIYTAMDQIFSKPILEDFERLHGIQVKAVYDVEAVKTTGIVNRLIAEKNYPQCDVFWNNEIMRTIMLKRKGVLAPYRSPSAQDIALDFKDKQGYWAGFAARARVLVINTDRVRKKMYPSSLQDLFSPAWRGQTAFANPLFGTTSTHIAAMVATQGVDASQAFLQGLVNNQTRIVDGNSVVRDMVARGDLAWGVTDTDDVHVGQLQGKPIAMVLPDQHGQGTLLIPNTVALIKNSPNPQEARLFIDYLLSREVEARLAASESAQIPLRTGVPVPEGQLSFADVKALPVDFEAMADSLEKANGMIESILLR